MLDWNAMPERDSEQARETWTGLGGRTVRVTDAGATVVKAKAYAALAAAGCLWGTGFLLGKIALTELAVPHMILYRLSLAACAFLPILLVRRVPIRRGDWPTILVAAVLGVPLLFLIQFEGLARTTVSHAALMVGIAPILLALAAAVFAHERIDTRCSLLLLTSTAGALLIVFATPVASGHRGPSVTGDMLVMASLVAAVGWVLISKGLLTRYPSTTVSAVEMVAGTVLLAAWVLATRGLPPVHLSGRVWSCLLAQGLFATTAATLLWNWGVARVPASEAGVFVNLEPALGTLLGVLILGDSLGWTGVVGGVLIIGAAVAMTRHAARS
jgi:drug/metabolite transporter (DMT)-like permease